MDRGYPYMVYAGFQIAIRNHSILSASTPLLYCASNLSNEIELKPQAICFFRNAPAKLHCCPPAHSPAVPLFMNHTSMKINTYCVHCPEAGCKLFKFWDLGITPTIASMHPTPTANQPPAPSLPQPLPFPMPAARAPQTICPTCSHQGIDCCKTGCCAHSTLPCKVHETFQLPVAQPPMQPSVPRPPPKACSHCSLDVLVAGFEDAQTAHNTPQCLTQLRQDHLTQQQEQAACLAALTALPPSPIRSQEDRDRNMVIWLALGNSPLPPTSSHQTHYITLSCWLSSNPGCTTAV
ncbi:hypothetical protein B0H14DRAFT_2625898 [Mycena olivaceomarginata]|nr:hypothetical protein B0H14DRAFT_2625898 [Mycena olivaceomarginata]